MITIILWVSVGGSQTYTGGLVTTKPCMTYTTGGLVLTIILWVSVGGSQTYWWFGVFMLVAAAINWFLLVLTRFNEAGEDDLNKG